MSAKARLDAALRSQGLNPQDFTFRSWVVVDGGTRAIAAAWDQLPDDFEGLIALHRDGPVFIADWKDGRLLVGRPSTPEPEVY